jgi:hypothetical protein
VKLQRKFNIDQGGATVNAFAGARRMGCSTCHMTRKNKKLHMSSFQHNALNNDDGRIVPYVLRALAAGDEKRSG